MSVQLERPLAPFERTLLRHLAEPGTRWLSSRDLAVASGERLVKVITTLPGLLELGLVTSTDRYEGPALRWAVTTAGAMALEQDTAA